MSRLTFSAAAARAAVNAKVPGLVDEEGEEEEPGEEIESAPPLRVEEERAISGSGLRKKLLKAGRGWETPVSGDEVTGNAQALQAHSPVARCESVFLELRMREFLFFYIPIYGVCVSLVLSGGNSSSLCWSSPGWKAVRFQQGQRGTPDVQAWPRFCSWTLSLHFSDELKDKLRLPRYFSRYVPRFLTDRLFHPRPIVPGCMLYLFQCLIAPDAYLPQD